jgi:hypothetical protein
VGALKRLQDLDETWQKYKVELGVLFGEEIAPLSEKLNQQGLNDLDEL